MPFRLQNLCQDEWNLLFFFHRHAAHIRLFAKELKWHKYIHLRINIKCRMRKEEEIVNDLQNYRESFLRLFTHSSVNPFKHLFSTNRHILQCISERLVLAGNFLGFCVSSFSPWRKHAWGKFWNIISSDLRLLRIFDASRGCSLMTSGFRRAK